MALRRRTRRRNADAYHASSVGSAGSARSCVGRSGNRTLFAAKLRAKKGPDVAGCCNLVHTVARIQCFASGGLRILVRSTESIVASFSISALPRTEAERRDPRHCRMTNYAPSIRKSFSFSLTRQKLLLRPTSQKQKLDTRGTSFFIFDFLL